uniref:Metalloendopeptidase n=1 Tax=Strongyloides stercoralis TaxID=6248 RepID=A0AAF5D1J0_STRER
MINIFFNFLLLYNVILTSQEYVKINKYPKVVWKLHQATGLEVFNKNITIQKVDSNNYVIKYEEHFAKTLSCKVLSNINSSPEYQKLIRDKKFKNPKTEICKKSFINNNKDKCERGSSYGETFTEPIETYKINYYSFKCNIIIYGDSENNNKPTDNFSTSLIIQPKERENFIHKKNSTENFYIKCHKEPIIKAGKLKTIIIFDNNLNIKSKTILFDDDKGGLQGTTEYLVTDEGIWIEVYFFQQKKEILDNVKVLCNYEYKKGHEIGTIEVTHTFEITNVNEVPIENDKWESFRPKVIEEANFECDLIGKFYSRRSSVWLKQLYIDKGVKVKNPQWKQVAKHGDPDFESSSNRLITKIRLKKESIEGMPNNVQSVWRLAFFTNSQDDIQCLLTFATPLTEESEEKIDIIKSKNDSLPIELACGEVNNLPLKWHHENVLLDEGKINLEESLYSSTLNKLVIKKCNEITMGSYMVFSQSNPSIFCQFSYECVEKYYRMEDLEKMYEDQTKSNKDPRTLYEIGYEEYGIDKNDDPYLIYRPSNKINRKFSISKKYLKNLQLSGYPFFYHLPMDAKVLILVFLTIFLITTNKINSTPIFTKEFHPPIICFNDSFYCGDGLCIDKSWHCDGEHDCLDGSDEVNCTAPNLPIICNNDTEFHCYKQKSVNFDDLPKLFAAEKIYKSFSCIPRHLKCDGEYNCINGEDEDDCEGEITCSDGSFKCLQDGEGMSTCIPEAWRCDGSQDCFDGADEANCSKVIDCSSERFLCKNGQCISKMWVCDGEKDCDDGTDEAGCRDDCNLQTHFKCKNSGRCLPLHLRCDGDADCSDHSDEHECLIFSPFFSRNCSVGEFRCNGGTRCISEKWKCDGDVDCSDGSDEQGCSEKICGEDQMKCDNVCREKFLWCDGVVDCNDGTDESNCPHVPDNATCNPTKQYECPGSPKTCINYEDLCNDQVPSNNCIASVCNKEIHSCRKGSPNCQCRDTKYNGSICYCKDGFILHDDICVDINECRTEGICDQICYNVPGSYKCDCHIGFKLIPENNHTVIPHKCRASGSNPLILLSNRASIRKYDMTKNTITPVISSLDSAVAMDYWHQNGIIIWSDLVNENIMSCSMGHIESDDYNINKCSTGNGTVLISNVNADGLAIDWVHGLLFWTDSILKQINVMDIKTRKSKVLFNTSLEEPRGIAVDPSVGLIFWTDWGKEAKIERSGMNGEYREVIASGDNIQWPNGLTLDILERKVYFADAKIKSISSMNYFGNNLKTVIHSHKKLKHPYSLAVFEEKLYWTDWDKEGIVSANKFNGNDATEILQHVSSPMTVRIFHEILQPYHPNKCKTHRCSDLCLPKCQSFFIPYGTEAVLDGLSYSCICSEGLILVNGTCVTNDGTIDFITSDDESSILVNVILVFIIFIFLVSLIGVVVFYFYSHGQRSPTKLLRYTNPMYKSTFGNRNQDMDGLLNLGVINTRNNYSNPIISGNDHRNNQYNAGIPMTFSNPTYEVR